MSNPFKKGDKVVRRFGHIYTPQWQRSEHGANQSGTVYEVTETSAISVWLNGSGPWAADRFRAAIAGQDYPLPKPDGLDAFITANSGHLSDGSSVQKHSAGALYPCVLVWRDAKLGGMVYDDFGALVPAKYDVGVISPRNPEPLWFSNFDRAVSVAATIKEDLQ